MRYGEAVIPGRPRYAIVVAASFLLALAAAAYGLVHLVQQRDRAPDFALTNQDGRPFTLSAQSGKVVVLFFGYTHCPDECPTTLAHIAAAVRSLGSSGDEIEPVFITVDPARDTITELKAYMTRFGPSFVGLTGSQGALEKTYTDYHVFAQNEPSAKNAHGYELVHSSALYYINRAGSLAAYGSSSDGIAAIAAQLRQLSS